MKSKVKEEVVNIEVIINEWLLDLVNGTVFQTDTAMYNKLHESVAKLKIKLLPKPVAPVLSETETPVSSSKTSESNE